MEVFDMADFFSNGSDRWDESILSDGGISRKKKKKMPNGRLAAIAVVLCLLVASVSGCTAGTQISNYFGLLSGEKKGEENNLVEDPTATIGKSAVEPSIYGSAGQDVFTISEVVRQVKDSVVVIEATVTTSDYFGRRQTGISAGSGIVISEDGYILTCNHVVDEAESVIVKIGNKSYDAGLVGSDAASDLAVLKVNATGLTYAKHGDSSALVVGENVVAIGNPLGTLGGTVTSGIISATERNISMEDGSTMTLLQTDAAINSGNSGGGLFNLKGELIGVVNAKFSATGVEGLAFAIPIDSAYEVELDLLQYGFVRGVIDSGLTLLTITSSNLPSYQHHYGITKIGVYVIDSEYCTDLKNKDLLISVDGTAVKTEEEVETIIKSHQVGDTLTIVASRDGSEFTTSLTLREYVPDRISGNLK